MDWFLLREQIDPADGEQKFMRNGELLEGLTAEELQEELAYRQETTGICYGAEANVPPEPT